ncbi:facilitated trehalose transporter Tret1-like [Lasioglossum baleicum]|uniref:facilitated trehalose transporter Tret1-like n=1 Tax=Lasioglossum baleicum TaxID=434251 RepID=UPI003FCDD5B6
MAEDEQHFKTLLKRRLPQYLGASTACMGGFSLGCGLGWSAPCVELLKANHGYGSISITVVASLFPVGAALGLLVVPFIIDKIGRKWTMMFLVPPFVIGWALIATAIPVVPIVVIGRLITGACGGMFCVVAPIYSAEISEKEIRGTLGVFFQLLLVIGVLYAYCCGYSKSVVVTSILCGIAPIVFALLMFFMPESPLHYIAKNKFEDAENSMRFFRGPDFDTRPEIAAFKEQIERTKTEEKVNVLSLARPPMLRTMAVAFGLMFAQQFSGINAIIFYGETIFKQTGVEMDSLLQMVIFAVVQVFACVVSAVLIDQVGRKVLMAVSSIVMCFCLVALGIFFILKDQNPATADSLSWLPLLSACVYILAFCLGAGPIPWAYMGEIFPSNVKGVAASCAGFFNWMLAFIVTMSFSAAAEALGTAVVLFFFAVICCLSVVFILFCMIETKGKTFDEIQREFGTLAVN